MSQQSAIEWTDATWNPVRGCVKVSPGCANCYAETFAERFRGVKGHPYEQGFDLRLVPEKLDEPLHWRKPRRVFVCSMSDLFQDGVSDGLILQVFATMRAASRHTFQVLTKRPARMLSLLSDPAFEAAIDDLTEPLHWPLPNVWLGVSVENQHFADERIPLLLQTPAAVRFISAEPLLEDISIASYLVGYSTDLITRKTNVNGPLDWVIVGGESGNGARPFSVAWASDLLRQCKAAGVAVFLKQLGDHAVGTELVLHAAKGGDLNEWPAHLRVREFPSA